MKDDKLFLKHVTDAILTIENYTKDVSRGYFLQNKLIQDGVIRELEIIGEAVKNLTERAKERETSIPWRKIIGMRDMLIHEYFGVDLEEVWVTVKNDLPKLKTAIEKIAT